MSFFFFERKIWWWDNISPFFSMLRPTLLHVTSFLLNHSHILSSRHRDISSIPKISLCSQRALNITECTHRTLLYLTFWELADICSNLYRGVIEIQRRCESCKEQNCSEEYSVPHKQKPQEHTYECQHWCAQISNKSSGVKDTLPCNLLYNYMTLHVLWMRSLKW